MPKEHLGVGETVGVGVIVGLGVGETVGVGVIVGLGVGETVGVGVVPVLLHFSIIIPAASQAMLLGYSPVSTSVEFLFVQ
ncbi:hypothetical protein COS78_01060 [Candidatus Shapirobacteria bacterium CG06_land_8_20_14_3_00_40_12]|uniref:Uncharacterized protein n=1 Tax=Candidatus Shapirobacteria bacterium CG06_land_8_20_14_3_00_40_12 TaxID=1974881 RepID=A0A2M7ASY4_9BACT|nr:MAG: hypothetical protein COS78_01060 [Candidatus Shapirobacteria bacterium CG06_land_8_20_14_3_00_40_12]